MVQVYTARRRQPDAPGQAMEKFCPRALFNSSNVAAKRGLRHVQFFGGGRNITDLGDMDEIPDAFHEVFPGRLANGAELV